MVVLCGGFGCRFGEGVMSDYDCGIVRFVVAYMSASCVCSPRSVWVRSGKVIVDGEQKSGSLRKSHNGGARNSGFAKSSFWSELSKHRKRKS